MVNKDDEKVRLVKELTLTHDKIKKFEDTTQAIVSHYSRILDAQLKEHYHPTVDDFLRVLVECQILNVKMNLENMRNGYSMQLEHELDKTIRETQINDQMTKMMKNFGLDEDTFKKFKKGFGSDDPGT